MNHLMNNNLNDKYIETLPRHVTTDEILTDCDTVQEECETCLKANAYRGEKNAIMFCHKICDRANYCKMRNHNYSQTCDPPYWNRHPLTPDP